MSEISFSDILIRPIYSEISSRSHVDLGTMMDKIYLPFLPVISANMPQISEWKMAYEMFVNGGMGILHRFCSHQEAVDEFVKADSEIRKFLSSGSEDAKEIRSAFEMLNPQDPEVKALDYCIGVSLGVQPDEKDRFKALYDNGAKVFCIDIAHGHCQNMRNMIEWIRGNSKDIVIIAGNVATREGYDDLCEWGANIVKVGIGPGKVCRTRSNTGVGVPQLSALMEIHEERQSSEYNVPVIADGGMQTSGDIAKALIFSDAVMIGAILAGTSETPGNAFPEPGTDLTNRTFYKMYGGSASQENKIANGQHGRFVEGEMLKIPFKGHAKYLLREIKDGIRSACSYVGADSLASYRNNVEWNVIGAGAKIESKL